MNLLKYFKRTKENNKVEEGVKVYLDFELKNFKYLPFDSFATSEELSKILCEELLKSGSPIIIDGKEILSMQDLTIKKFSALFLIIKMYQTNIMVSQRKLNFYENPSALLQNKEKTFDSFLIFSLTDPIYILKSSPPRKNSKRAYTAQVNQSLNTPKKRKKIDFVNVFEEEYIRSGYFKKKNKKGDFIEKMLFLFKDRLLYHEPKDSGFLHSINEFNKNFREKKRNQIKFRKS